MHIVSQTLSLENSYIFCSFGHDKHFRNGDITSLNIFILGGHFRIFMVLLVAVQASAIHVVVSPWYSIFPQNAVFGRLAGQESAENGEFGSISDALCMGSTLSPMHRVLYWYRLSLLEFCKKLCLSVCPALRPTCLVFNVDIFNYAT